ncbi:MAG: glycosyltransferase [Anaerolineae bacterium]|jgi:glycosyltransferase involved in cell wall biosynthesis|nr:glycosyltransferase [Anaerolineae bacterium]
MQTQPKISIISPSLNQGSFIEETILSVLSQEYENLEYIVVDGLSTDKTLSILRKYSDNLTWISEKDNGQTNAINKGIRLATGEIIGYLNSDDILLPNALKSVAQAFRENPSAMWITGKSLIIDEEGKSIRKLITKYKNLYLKTHSFKSLLVADYISQPATFWKKEIISDVGYLDESLDYVMDYEYWLRIYQNFKPVFINQYLASFRIHHASKTTSGSYTKKYIDEERKIIVQYSISKFWLLLNKSHRFLTNFVYSILNIIFLKNKKV